jgi:hypothetical protein
MTVMVDLPGLMSNRGPQTVVNHNDRYLDGCALHDAGPSPSEWRAFPEMRLLIRNAKEESHVRTLADMWTSSAKILHGSSGSTRSQ